MNKTQGRKIWDKITLGLNVKGISQSGEYLPVPLGKGPKLPSHCTTPVVGRAGVMFMQLCPKLEWAEALEFKIFAHQKAGKYLRAG